MEVHSLFLLQSIIHVDSTGASLTCQSTPAYRREHFGFGSKRSLLALFSFLVEREISLLVAEPGLAPAHGLRVGWFHGWNPHRCR